MLYVILSPRPEVREMTRVLFSCRPTSFAELAQAFASTHAPTSAGFMEMLPGGEVRVFGYSMSLRMGPGPADAKLIKSFIRATAMTATLRPGEAGPASAEPTAGRPATAATAAA